MGIDIRLISRSRLVAMEDQAYHGNNEKAYYYARENMGRYSKPIGKNSTRSYTPMLAIEANCGDCDLCVKSNSIAGRCMLEAMDVMVKLSAASCGEYRDRLDRGTCIGLDKKCNCISCVDYREYVRIRDQRLSEWEHDRAGYYHKPCDCYSDYIDGTPRCVLCSTLVPLELK